MENTPLFEWFMSKPHPQLNQILEKAYRNWFIVDWEEKDINLACAWQDTNEGHDYWLEVYTWYVTH